MKSFFASAILAISAIFAASAEPVMYEASFTDIYGTPSRFENVTLRLSLVDADGNTLYAETHNASTDHLGRLHALVGSGVATEGSFSDAAWEAARSMGVSILRADGSEMNDVANLGYTPVALHAATASGLVSPYDGKGRYHLGVDDNGNLSTSYLANESIEIPEGYTRLLFHDEFDGEGLPNPEFWGYEEGKVRNGELQVYVANRLENCNIHDGILHLIARREAEPYTCPDGSSSEYTSASIHTQNKVKFTYGRVDVRAKLPAIKGTWPAIWLMPNDSHYGMWPRSGEIDIMENVGYDPNVVHFTAHTYQHNSGNGNKHNHSMRVLNPTTPSEDFHVYSLEWTENKLTWLVDGKRGYTMVRNSPTWLDWPFDQDFYLILNLAWGGSWGGQQGIEPDKLPQTYEIDYVRIFQ